MAKEYHLYMPPRMMEIFRNSEMTPTELLLAATIDGMSLHNKFNACYATNAHLAKLTKLSTRHVKRMLQNLKDLGVIAEVRPDADPHRETHKRYLQTAWSYRSFTPNTDGTNQPEMGGHTRPTVQNGGGHSRHLFPQNTVTSMSRGGGHTCHPDSNRDSNIPETDTNKTPYSPPGDERAFFESFWKSYPAQRREGKDAAARAFEIAVKKKGADPSAIVSAVKEYAASGRVKELIESGEVRYIPIPSTWLNAGRYDDDRTAWQRPEDNASATPKPYPRGNGTSVPWPRYPDLTQTEDGTCYLNGKHVYVDELENGKLDVFH